MGPRQQVRGGNCLDSAAETRQQKRRQTLTDEGGAASSREDDPQIRSCPKRLKKTPDDVSLLLYEEMRSPPARRLLRDLARCPQPPCPAKGNLGLLRERH